MQHESSARIAVSANGQKTIHLRGSAAPKDDLLKRVLGPDYRVKVVDAAQATDLCTHHQRMRH